MARVTDLYLEMFTPRPNPTGFDPSPFANPTQTLNHDGFYRNFRKILAYRFRTVRRQAFLIQPKHSRNFEVVRKLLGKVSRKSENGCISEMPIIE